MHPGECSPGIGRVISGRVLVGVAQVREAAHHPGPVGVDRGAGPHVVLGERDESERVRTIGEPESDPPDRAPRAGLFDRDHHARLPG